MSVRWGLSSNARQIRPTVDFDRPLRLAIEARDQCVASRSHPDHIDAGRPGKWRSRFCECVWTGCRMIRVPVVRRRSRPSRSRRGVEQDIELSTGTTASSTGTTASSTGTTTSPTGTTASPTDTTATAQLQQQLNQLRAARATQGNQAAILQAATPSATPVGPQMRRTVELGLVIGLLLALGAIALAENADRRLRTPDDLEGMTDLPLLAAIPPSAFSGQLDTGNEDEEAFHMLRTALMYFNVDRRLDSVVVTSPGEKDGKTTVATRLALVTARTGLHVVLVDADLRRAQVSARLGIQAQEGLGAVLAGQRSLSEELVDYPIADPGSGRLTVLPAGPPPPNPAVLLSSEEMQRVLRKLEADSDLVIIDTPAALAVSDPVPLMPSVTGIILVARMNRSSRETIRRLQRMVESAHGTLLGVVATGVTAGPGYEHYSPKYYTHNGTNGSGGSGRLRRRQRATESNVTAPPLE